MNPNLISIAMKFFIEIAAVSYSRPLNHTVHILLQLSITVDMSSPSSSSSLHSPFMHSPSMHSPSKSSRLIVSPLFRGIAEEMDRDHSIDPITDDISASIWKESQEWKNV